MKKKYLFKSIEIHESRAIHFIPFRKPSTMESFLAFTNGTTDENKWEFIPTSYKEFLKMLSKTKLDNDCDYKITMEFAYIDMQKDISFEKLLKIFASNMCDIKAPNKDILIKFYTKAYQIKKEAQNERKLLNSEPTELIK